MFVRLDIMTSGAKKGNNPMLLPSWADHVYTCGRIISHHQKSFLIIAPATAPEMWLHKHDDHHKIYA